MKKRLSILLVAVMLLGILTGCAGGKETIIIYTAASDYRIAHMTEALEK